MAETTALVASCLKIAISAGKLTHDLQSLANAYKNVERNLNLLSAQVSALKAVTTQLRVWINKSGTKIKFHDGLDQELQDILDGCVSLLDLVAQHVSGILKNSTRIGFRAKVRHIWGSNDLADYREWLRSHFEALSVIMLSLQMSVSVHIYCDGC
jgi:hypothetical protein